MSKEFRTWNIEQEYLFPPSVKDFVPEGHLAHFIRDLVREELDMSGILNDYVEERGKPPYHPTMMTAVLLYSYMQGVYSSRKIARACEERIDFMAVSALEKPDFRTVAKFRKRHLEALGDLFVQVLKLCKAAELTKMGHVSLDGSKIKANASMSRSRTYKHLKKEEEELRKQVSGWLKRAEASDSEEDKSFGENNRGDELPDWIKDKQERYTRIKKARETLEAKAKEELEERKEAEKEGSKPQTKTKQTDKPKESRQYNFTDPDSEIMRSSHGFQQSYNAQVSVDSESYVIVECHLSNAKNDLNELVPSIKGIKDNLNEVPTELSADAGYCSNENLKAIKEAQIRGYVALGGGSPGEREKTILPGTLVSEMAQRLRKGGRRTRYRLRKHIVEPVFGVIKSARGFNTFLLRGIANTQNEWKLVCTAYNLHKLAASRR